MTTLPATMPSKDAMVDVAERWIDTVAAKMKSEHAHAVMRDYIRELVKLGTLPIMAVREAARRGNLDADWALRKRAAEALDNGEEMSAQLRTFAAEALVENLPTRGRRGDDITDLWSRDLGIAVMVDLATIFWGLRPTRNRASKRPSASTIVWLALKRRGFGLGELQVERIYGQFHTLAARLSATIPIPDPVG